MEYTEPDWREYNKGWNGDPHSMMESLESEIQVVDRALSVLRDNEMIPHVTYDHDKFTAHRNAVKENFEIPWTGITPRMQRLL